MRAKYIILALIITGVAISYATDAYIEFFYAKSDGKSIKITWKSNNEGDVDSYVLERAGEKQPYQKIVDFNAEGAGHIYNYTDDEAFMRNTATETPETERTYTYRLKIIKTNNSYVYSNSVNVSHDISSIRRTWGMIKEMFR